jgi:UDP-N-acetyl-D-mannosaminuronic acid dehydrogenase/UDP-N-acetyl-D-glucosamine dehydrogenase
MTVIAPPGAPPRKLTVVGQGYVGLPLAIRAVEAGFSVVGLDTDPVRTDALASGSSYIEDVGSQRLGRALETGRYLPTTSYDDAASFDAAIITVPTPLRDSLPDLSFITGAATELATHLKCGAVVVLESTTYPGTTEEVLVPLLEQGSGLVAGRDFYVGYSPERVDPGNPRWWLENTPKVVSGIDRPSLSVVQKLYSSLVETTVVVSGCREAELTKLLENTFRHVNIALINEIAMFARELGIDVWEVIDAASTKPFGYMRFTPGPGVGGHCLPVDPTYLSWQVRRLLRRSFRFVELANDINEHMPDHVAIRIAAGLNLRGRAVNGSDIVVFGLAYKPNTGDVRESPAVRVVELLADLGANVQVVDSHVEPHKCPPRVKLTDVGDVRLDSADAVVLLTDHDDFDYRLLEKSSAWILDTRHRLVSKNVEYL